MSWYKKIDKKLGGWLPGGVTKRDAPLAPGQQGPVRPQPVFQGPVRPGTDEKTFRETGRSIPSSGGGSRRGGGSSGKGARVSGPLPAGTTPAQKQEFRKTGSISTPIVPTASTSVTQVKDKEAGTPSPSISILVASINTSLRLSLAPEAVLGLSKLSSCVNFNRFELLSGTKTVQDCFLREVFDPSGTSMAMK